MMLNHPQFVVKKYIDIAPNVKTGDLIMFRGLDNAHSLFIGCYYTHIGIVWIDPEDPNQMPMIFEAFNPKTMQFAPVETPNGITLSQLEHRMNTYRGYCFYKELEHPITDINILMGFKDYIKYCQENMYYEGNVICSGLSKIIGNDHLRINTNCGEFTYMCLIKLGLLSDEYIENNRKHQDKLFPTPQPIHAFNFTPVLSMEACETCTFAINHRGKAFYWGR